MSGSDTSSSTRSVFFAGAAAGVFVVLTITAVRSPSARDTNRSAPKTHLRTLTPAKQIEALEPKCEKGTSNPFTSVLPKGGGHPRAGTGVWPAHVATEKWRERRVFDRAAAIKEIDYPAVSSGGLKSEDIATLAKWYYKANSVYEIGIGESTKIATFTGVPRLTGVDGALQWINSASNHAPPHYRFHWADMGEIKYWSRPANDKAKAKWPMYSFAALAAESEGFDVYLVDGRFRVACACMCLLHAAATGKKPDEFVVGIHDFRNRWTPGKYGAIFEVADRVDGFDKNNRNNPAKVLITMFRRKPDITDDAILKVWERFKFNHD